VNRIAEEDSAVNCLARLEGETSNQIFEALEEWNNYLKRHAPTFRGPSP
jgi:hypothetical protein